MFASALGPSGALGAGGILLNQVGVKHDQYPLRAAEKSVLGRVDVVDGVCEKALKTTPPSTTSTLPKTDFSAALNIHSTALFSLVRPGIFAVKSCRPESRP
jgi:hypothetical protein